MPSDIVKEKRKDKAKSMLGQIMTFGARDIASNKPREKFLDRKKMKRFKFKR